MAGQKVSERLLRSTLRQSIAERPKGRPAITADGFSEIIADSHADVTVSFTEIVEFTKFAESVSAAIVVDALDDIVTCFDKIADKHGLEKIKRSVTPTWPPQDCLSL